MTQPLPGWYPDPADPRRQRYFDGKVWTENYAPFGPPRLDMRQPPKTGMSTGMKVVLGLGAGLLGLLVIVSIGSNSDKKTESSSSRPATTTSAYGAAPTAGAFSPPAEPPAAVVPRFSPAQENAIAKAESYLDYSAFSKQGLIGQLEYDDFSAADATFAVEHLESTGGVNWNEQATRKAKSYLDYTSFSLQGLTDQLVYDKFTPSQAEYGASSAYGG